MYASSMQRTDFSDMTCSIARSLAVAGEPWSIENGLLTPTMKIRRARIEGAVEPQVERWYGARGTVIWS